MSARYARCGHPREALCRSGLPGRGDGAPALLNGCGDQEGRAAERLPGLVGCRGPALVPGAAAGGARGWAGGWWSRTLQIAAGEARRRSRLPGWVAALRIALLSLGAALLATPLVLCLLPGPLASCGSLLAPEFPVRIASRCPASQNSHLLAAIVTGAAGLAGLVAGVTLRPAHRHNHSHHRPHDRPPR